MHKIPTKIKEEVSEAVASYPTFDEAQKAVNDLNAHDFPTQYASIAADGILHHSQRKKLKLLFTLLISALLGATAPWGILMTDSAIDYNSLGNISLIGMALGLVFGIGVFIVNNPKKTSARDLFEAKYFDVIIHSQYAKRARDILNASTEREPQKTLAVGES